MYTKVSFALITALVAQAAYAHQGHAHLHHKKNTFPTLSGSGVLPQGLAPFSTGASGAPTISPFPTGTGAVQTGAPSSTGGAPESTGGFLSTGAPISTGASASETSSNGAEESGDTTLTYTIGTGSSTTVITTTIRRQRTIYQTASSSAAAASASASGEGAEGATTARQTLLKTIQSTIYVTSASATDSVVAPSLVAKPSQSGSGDGNGNGNGNGNGGGCAPQVTVTVTGPEQTVTVTASSGSNPSEAPGSSPESSAAGEAASSAAPSVTPTLGNGPHNNGTRPTSKTRTKCKSTGFITKPSASFTLHPTSTGMFPPVGTVTPQAYRH